MWATFSLTGNEVILGSCFGSCVYLWQYFVSMGTGASGSDKEPREHTPPDLRA